MVGHEGSILHKRTLEETYRSIIQEVNEEIDYWYYLLEPKYKQFLLRRNV